VFIIVKTGAGAHSLTAGEAENAPHLRIKRNHIVDVVTYCDKAVGITQQIRYILPQWRILHLVTHFVDLAAEMYLTHVLKMFED
jgi:hypothetical protein